MINIYKVTHSKYRGAAYLMFKKAEIREVLIEFDPFLEGRERAELAQYLPFKEEEFVHLESHTDFVAAQLKPRTVADKVAAFCMRFRAHRNSPYTCKKTERANLNEITMSDRLLEVYFTTDTYPLSYAKSITDYIKHYNYIRDIATNGKPVKSGFPDVYDREYERTLEPEKLSLYWQHISKLGWRKVDGVWMNQQTLNFKN
jgi:hypothetical protein